METTEWDGEVRKTRNFKVKKQNGKEREMQKMLVSVERRMHVGEIVIMSHHAVIQYTVD